MSNMRQIATVLAFLGMLTVNALANILPINGQQTGEISDRFPSLFTPAGYVFSIWGLIYLLLTAFVVFQALPGQRDNDNLRSIRDIFVVNAIANSAWIFAWHFEQIEISLGVMLVILGTLIAIYQMLDIGRADVSLAERLTTHLAFSVYLGWITVATVANVSVTLIDNGFDGGELAPFLTAVTIAVATSIGLAALLIRSDIAFAAVLVWAFVGIAVQQSDNEMVVVLVAGGAAAVITVVALLQLGRRTSVAM